MLITTSSFSQEAENYVKRIEKKIVLIDGKTLARLMIDFDVGVSEIVTYRIKKSLTWITSRKWVEISPPLSYSIKF